MNGLAHSVSSAEAAASKCERCGGSTRLGDESCVSCLLKEGLDAKGEPSAEVFERVLEEANVPDKQWRVGNYKILEEIGRGGMGVIYRARQRHSRRIVALKRMLTYHADAHETLARFRREAEAAASLDHPNILPIYEVNETEDGLPFFSMKLATGGSLRTAAPALRNDPRECVRLIAKVARAIEYAHQHGILHRDLQPGNVLLDARGEPMVSDFGLAKWLDQQSDLTRTLTSLGTPGFIAPEQAEGTSFSPAADIYSLGAILFNLLVGRPPFVGNNALSVIRQAAAQPAPKLRFVARSFDRDLETIVARCLERDPKARYKTAAALANDLEHWLEGRPITARPVRAPARVWRWSRRNPILTGAAVACLFLTITVSWLLRERLKISESAPPPQKSVAVLPLENLSRDPQNRYLATGVQEEILAHLAKVADLKVISRTSTQSYKSQPTNLREIARRLGVANVLEGSIQRTGDQVRITVQLINALNDSLLWADTYDRKFLDMFQVESDVAQRVADSLQAQLTGRERSEVAAGPDTNNPQAYDAYLRALALSNEQGLEELKRFTENGRQAVSLDPQYAKAWALLATAEALQYLFPSNTSKAQFERAKVAAETALRLAPDLAEAHAGLAQFYYLCVQDYDRALGELKLALERAPNNARWWLFTGVVRRRQGELDESIKTHKRAAELDPLNPDIWANLARSYRSNHDFKAALTTYERALAVKPNDSTLLAEQGETLLAAGDLQAAEQILTSQRLNWPSFVPRGYVSFLIFERQFDQAAQLLADLDQEKRADPFYTALGHSLLATTYTLKGDKVAARPLLIQAEQELKDLRAKGNQSPAVAFWLSQIDAWLGRRDDVEHELQVLIRDTEKDRWGYPRPEEAAARAYTILGEYDRALPALEQAISQPTQWGLTTALLRFEPDWDPLRGDSRFEKIVASSAPKPQQE
jgi:serine/threonine protein kinase/Tfp pilus assembly protein PilF